MRFNKAFVNFKKYEEALKTHFNSLIGWLVLLFGKSFKSRSISWQQCKICHLSNDIIMKVMQIMSFNYAKLCIWHHMHKNKGMQVLQIKMGFVACIICSIKLSLYYEERRLNILSRFTFSS